MDYSIIKQRRALLSLTQQDLADYAGVSLRIIRSIEAGKGNPSVATISKIAEVLGLQLQLNVKEVVK
ncbi:helix-turn-helix transcriptional regulator [Alistipes putredinis]|jgi:Predicted transcriptional regulators|uniref:helix-turn-helix transcriptional regulator n=1 Tax=Alistipes putredinis TaxID=28117 RepID=UPI00189701D0|nr:MAG TPA: transcriptional regulator, y4mF family [Caudoviricetes sp.]